MFIEQAQCTHILETISHQVNSQHSELAAHRLLSIFKMAEVQIIWPEVSKCSLVREPLIMLTFLTVFIYVFVPVVRWLINENQMLRTKH